MQILNVDVSFLNHPGKGTMPKFYGVQVWVQGMCYYATFDIYYVHMHLFAGNENVTVLAFQVFGRIVYSGEGDHTEAF